MDLKAASIGLGWWADELASSIQGKSDKIGIRSCYSRSPDKREAFAAKQLGQYRLKKLLGNQAPPVLFGCGNQQLLRDLKTHGLTMTMEATERVSPEVAGSPLFGKTVVMTGTLPATVLTVTSNSAWTASIVLFATP